MALPVRRDPEGNAIEFPIGRIGVLGPLTPGVTIMGMLAREVLKTGFGGPKAGAVGVMLLACRGFRGVAQLVCLAMGWPKIVLYGVELVAWNGTPGVALFTCLATGCTFLVGESVLVLPCSDSTFAVFGGLTIVAVPTRVGGSNQGIAAALDTSLGPAGIPTCTCGERKPVGLFPFISREGGASVGCQCLLAF